MTIDTESQEYLDFATIKQEAIVVVVLATLGLLHPLELRGEELVGRCMLGSEPHGKDDSFAFNTRKKTFQCFACKERGSVLDFVAKYNHSPLRDAAGYVSLMMSNAKALDDSQKTFEALVKASALVKEGVECADASASGQRTTVRDEQVKKVAVHAVRNPDEPCKAVDLQHAVMSWSLAQFRVQDGKLNPDDLVVVDVATLEFMRQLVAEDGR